MALDEWIILPDDEFLDQNGEKVLSVGMDLDTEGLVRMNYFNWPFSPHQHLKTMETSIIPCASNQLVPVLVLSELEEKNQDHELPEKTREVLIAETGPELPFAVECQDRISQVVDKLENELFHMKMGLTRSQSRELGTQMELSPTQNEDREVCKDENLEHDTFKMGTEHENGDKKSSETKERGCSEFGGVTVRRWKAIGIQVLCSIGVATAAAVCLFNFGNHGKVKQRLQNLQFRIYLRQEGF